MAEQQFTDEYEADAPEQPLPVDQLDEEAVAAILAEPEPSPEVDPADAAEQAVPVPVDEDEYR
jgi:hypothetical protein